MTEWRHVDFEAGTWFIPKENVKGSRGKKRDHFVYLSPFALRQFRELARADGKDALVLPRPRRRRAMWT